MSSNFGRASKEQFGSRDNFNIWNYYPENPLVKITSKIKLDKEHSSSEKNAYIMEINIKSNGYNKFGWVRSYGENRKEAIRYILNHWYNIQTLNR